MSFPKKNPNTHAWFMSVDKDGWAKGNLWNWGVEMYLRATGQIHTYFDDLEAGKFDK